MKSYTKRQIHKARGIKTWYLREYNNGRTRYTSLKTTSARVAQEIVDRMNAARFFKGVQADEFERHVDLVQASNDYLDYVSVTFPKSFESYKYHIQSFMGFCGGLRLEFVEDVTPAVAMKYVEQAIVGGTNVRTMKSRIAVIGKMLERAAKKNDVHFDDPFRNVEMPKAKPTGHDEFWTVEEIEKILDAADSPELRLVWAFEAFMGLRVHEAIKVKNQDINGDNLRVLGKGGRIDTLSLGSRIKKEIKRYGGDLSNLAKVVNYKVANRHLKTACDRAGVDRGSWCTTHKLRHSYASNLASIGTPFKVNQALMRHATAAMTMNVYAHVKTDDEKKWADKI